jgi:PKD repeat protein
VPDSGEKPLQVSFDASASSDSDGLIVSYSWDFGGGQSGSGKTTSHTYVNKGMFTVTLTVTDNRHGSATASRTVDVQEPPPPPPSPFTLTAEPNMAEVIQGQTVSYAVRLNSTTSFSQLAALGVAGLRTGVSGAFKPKQLAVGQTSILTIATPSGQAPGAIPLSVSALAEVNGQTVTKSTDLMLHVQPITTSFLGRTVVADTLETPLASVTVKFLGKDDNGNPTGCSGQTVSDAAGNFMFTNLPPECTGRQLIRYDGLTATAPPGDYAGVDLVYDIVTNQVTTSPVLVHLPRIDDKETVPVQQNAPTDQIFHFTTIPGLSVTVYAGTTFTLVDGTQPNPFPLTAIQVPVDRLPDAKPPNPQMMMVFIVAFQPANAEASQPVAVYFPNTINTPPGINMVLMTLDPTKGQMAPYGTGTVPRTGRRSSRMLIPCIQAIVLASCISTGMGRCRRLRTIQDRAAATPAVSSRVIPSTLPRASFCSARRTWGLADHAARFRSYGPIAQIPCGSVRLAVAVIITIATCSTRIRPGTRRR